jgi:hypothetical protein
MAKKKRSCSGKKKYETPEEAEQVIEWSKRATGAYLRHYRCPSCSFYHLAHYTKNQIR